MFHPTGEDALPFWRGGIGRPARINAFARRRIRAFDIRPPNPRTLIDTLSGGNRQKVLLTRELNNRARAVIFAKLTYGLDLHNSLAIRERIRQTAARGVAVVLISTDLDELLTLAQRVAVLRRGQIAGMVEKDIDARRRIGMLISKEAQ